jgi:Putative restriction endonuclease
LSLPTRFFTVREFLDYDDGSNHHPYELVDGRIIAIGDKSLLNCDIAMMLLFQFFKTGLTHRQLAIGHYLITSATKETCRQPSLMIHSTGSGHAIFQDGRILPFEGEAPLLVVEVVDGDDTDQRDYIAKRDEYADRGIPEYWLVDPIAGLVIIFNLVGRTYQAVEFRGTQPIASFGFPGITLTAEQILTADCER